MEISIRPDQIESFKISMHAYRPIPSATTGEYLPLVQSNANPQEFFIWRSAEVFRGYHEWRCRNEVLEEMFAEAFKAR